MAIILIEGFKFITDIAGNPESIIVTGDNLEAEIDYITKNKIKSIYLTFFLSSSIKDLNFLHKIPHIEKINLNGIEADYSGLYHLNNLKSALITVKNKGQHLDFSKFADLELLSIDWYQDFPDFRLNAKLESLEIDNFKPKSKNFTSLSLSSGLRHLKIVRSNINSFIGISDLKSLIKLECSSLPYLINLEGLDALSDNLKILILENCKGLRQYESEFSNLRRLEKLILSNCGEMASIEFIKDLPNLKFFSFVNTNILDGNIRPALGLSYIGFNDKKHYSHKWKDVKKENLNKIN